MYLMNYTDKDNGIHQFQYITRQNLPPRDSYSVDYWGYYNAKLNITLVPTFGPPYSEIVFPGADRSLADGSLQSGSLERITYPTGGYTVFELEPHKADVSGYLGGGLRIKTISNYEADNTLLSQKKYTYHSNTDNGPGDVGMLGNYMDLYIQRKYNPASGTYFPTDTQRCEFTILSSTTSPLFEGIDFNAGVQYPVVTVTDLDETISGKSVFYYGGLDFGHSYPTPKPDGRNESKLMKEEHYSYTGTNSYTLLSQKAYEYEVHPNITAGFTITDNVPNYQQTLGFRIKYDLPEQASQSDIPMCYPATFSFQHYKYTSIWHFLKSVTENIFDGSDYLAQTRQFDYENPDHAQLTKTTTYNSKGDLLTHLTRYPQDYQNGGIEQGSSAVQQLFKGVPIEELNFVNSNLVSGQLNEMKFENNLLKLSKKYVSNLSSPLNDQVNYPPSNSSPFTHYSSLFPAGNPYREFYSIVSTDTKGNPIELKSTDGKFSQSMLWNSAKRQVLAICDNASSADVAYTDFDSPNKGSWSYSNNNYTAPGSGFATSIAFNGTSITRSGLTTAMKYRVSAWAKNGTAPSITGFTATTYAGNDGWTLYEWIVNNLSAVTINTTSGTLLDNVRLCPADSKMITYGYQPLVGLVCKTDANNRSEYYNYDSACRLVSVRDDAKNILKTFEYHIVNTQP